MSKKKSKVRSIGLYRALSTGAEVYATSRRHAWMTLNNWWADTKTGVLPRSYWRTCIKDLDIASRVPLDPPVPYKVARKLCQDLNAAKGL